MYKPPYIIELKTLPFVRRWVEGIAFYPFIFIKKMARTQAEYKTLIEHEKIHIRQQLNGWIVGFYVSYFYYNWKYGYKNNPYEVEAYEHQDDWKR